MQKLRIRLEIYKLPYSTEHKAWCSFLPSVKREDSPVFKNEKNNYTNKPVNFALCFISVIRKISFDILNSHLEHRLRISRPKEATFANRHQEN